MEDYNSNLLNDSKNEWSIRLMNILCGHVIDGFRSIFNESVEMCDKNEEPEKYLMTFQNFLSRIPKWNQNMISQECTRIKDSSNCAYLEDLITCVHIIQLKILSCVRTSSQVKKIDIDIPSLDSFLHLVYINIARKLYSNIYLFQVDVTPLEQQKNNREFENIVQVSIMNTIRDNIPIDTLLRQYMDETQEEGFMKEEKTEPLPKEQEIVEPPITPSVKEENNPPPANINFEEKVEKYNPITEEKVKENINFEPKPEPEPINDYLDDDDDEKITIGESIKLDLGETTLDKKEDHSLTPISLDTLEIVEEPKKEEPKNDIIDLGIEEIKL